MHAQTHSMYMLIYTRSTHNTCTLTFVPLTLTHMLTLTRSTCVLILTSYTFSRVNIHTWSLTPHACSYLIHVHSYNIHAHALQHVLTHSICMYICSLLMHTHALTRTCLTIACAHTFTLNSNTYACSHCSTHMHTYAHVLTCPLMLMHLFPMHSHMQSHAHSHTCFMCTFTCPHHTRSCAPVQACTYYTLACSYLHISHSVYSPCTLMCMHTHITHTCMFMHTHMH